MPFKLQFKLSIVIKFRCSERTLLNFYRVLKGATVGYSQVAVCVSTLVTKFCEPRQARKGATVAVASGAKGLLAQAANYLQL